MPPTFKVPLPEEKFVVVEEVILNVPPVKLQASSISKRPFPVPALEVEQRFKVPVLIINVPLTVNVPLPPPPVVVLDVTLIVEAPVLIAQLPVTAMVPLDPVVPAVAVLELILTVPPTIVSVGVTLRVPFPPPPVILPGVRFMVPLLIVNEALA